MGLIIWIWVGLGQGLKKCNMDADEVSPFDLFFVTVQLLMFLLQCVKGSHIAMATTQE